MKKILAMLFVLITMTQLSLAQWSTGTNIYNTNSGNVGIGTTNAYTPLTIGNGNNNSGSAIVTINSGNANSSALLLSNWIGSGTTYGPRIAFDNSTKGAWYVGSSDGANNFDIARTWGTPDFRIASNGYIGIGTTSPAYKLDIRGGNAAIYNSGYGSELMIGTTASGATSIHISTSADVNGYGLIQSISQQGSSWGNTIINPNGGKIGIGTTSPDQMLTVNGTIHTKEVKVDLSVPFPDYVFKPTYTLPSLTEVKTYIDQNHHLPNMPSAEDVSKNGLNLGEMNALLVRKVEELTLFLIEKNKQFNKQQEVILSLQKDVNQLNHQLLAIIKASKKK